MFLILILSFSMITAELTEIEIKDCEAAMKHWEFICLEMYSPYLCQHFLKDNMSVLNRMIQAKFGANLNCVH